VVCVVTKQLDVWLNKNDLVVNTIKTVAMSFHYRQLTPLKPIIYIQNSKISYKSEVKFLGIYIMENLNWQSHFKSSRTVCKTRSNQNQLTGGEPTIWKDLCDIIIVHIFL
jgi:hypothetical protein